MKNIGFSKQMAKDVAGTLNCQDAWDAYPQKEEHFNITTNGPYTYQWIVVVQKKPKKKSTS